MCLLRSDVLVRFVICTCACGRPAERSEAGKEMRGARERAAPGWIVALLPVCRIGAGQVFGRERKVCCPAHPKGEPGTVVRRWPPYRSAPCGSTSRDGARERVRLPPGDSLMRGVPEGWGSRGKGTRRGVALAGLSLRLQRFAKRTLCGSTAASMFAPIRDRGALVRLRPRPVVPGLWAGERPHERRQRAQKPPAREPHAAGRRDLLNDERLVKRADARALRREEPGRAQAEAGEHEPEERDAHRNGPRRSGGKKRRFHGRFCAEWRPNAEVNLRDGRERSGRQAGFKFAERVAGRNERRWP